MAAEVEAPQQTHGEEVKQPSHLRSFIAGGIGGTALVVVGHPFDTVKVKIQTMTPGVGPQYTGVMDCARQTLAQQGFRGLYNGVLAPLAGVTPMFALCFFGYSVGKDMFCDADAFDPHNLKLVQIGLAGATSAAFTTPLLAPGERVKCLLQSQDPKNPKYSGTGDAFKKIYKEGGLRSVNRGFTGTFLRDATGSAFYFSSYEYLKVLFTPEGQTSPSVVGTLVAGGLAGMLNWTAMLPLDTLKTRLQVAPEGKYGNIHHVFADIMRNEGPRALFRGFSAAMVRAFPANAACFFGYEGALKFMDWLGLD
ncbi:uncharacterized protein MONBRDRAFT_17649 [Monosiga brevicollis MX1]|uniref:Mitochondrial carnitine/acylcarnitine carrier protein n=1 Tax=Monosiga brevicollis TaxID=81824 RepID=A9USM6_MONBE|nr:uncharacterized protein MONBRDRAFT_17649 [Monosiga brevicollis MX1]EDQ91806.1 predicted protein [Monosiga brevicollis MX1]|eukprot:XP_001743092.1 hypothetical protein [Monosiga brevicollis MX1]